MATVTRMMPIPSSCCHSGICSAHLRRKYSPAQGQAEANRAANPSHSVARAMPYTHALLFTGIGGGLLRPGGSLLIAVYCAFAVMIVLTS